MMAKPILSFSLFLKFVRDQNTLLCKLTELSPANLLPPSGEQNHFTNHSSPANLRPVKSFKAKILSACLLSLFWQIALSQRSPGDDRFGSPSAVALMNSPIGDANLTSNYILKGGVFFSCGSGFGFSFAAGAWVRNSAIQGSSNVSLNVILGPKALGNKEGLGPKKNLNWGMVNLNFSTLLTWNLWSRSSWYYEEINPMYFGNRTGVYNSYQNAFTLGTTFVTYPKGTYNNITSPRNRSQQLVFFQIKCGGKQASDPSSNYYLNSILINVCEDFLGNPSQPLADLRDRFYTGGGNLQIRIANHYIFKYFTETYTGNSYVDKQDYPDLVVPGRPRDAARRKLKNFHERFAYQDPGQLGLNKARNFLSFEYRGLNLGNSEFKNYAIQNIEVFVGAQGAMWNAWSQHIIHNWVTVEKNKKMFNNKPENVFTMTMERLHHFKYDNYPTRPLIGINSDFIIK